MGHGTWSRLARRAGAAGFVFALVTTTVGVAGAAPSTWTPEPSPNRAGNNQISDVSCASATACMAVGTVQDLSETNDKALAMSWNGHRWKLSPVITRRASTLYHVSCASPTFCIAIGSGSTKNSSGALAEKWDGARWSVIKNPAGPKISFYRAVACSSPTRCFITGARVAGGGASSVIVQWDGAQLATIANTDAGGLLIDVSCASTAWCVAVGSGGVNEGELRVETYDGVSWTNAGVPAPSTIADLSVVSCGSATSCIALGQYYDWDTGFWPTLVERWDGVSWTHDPDPVAKGSFLGDLSCASATDCVGVGGRPGTGKYGANLAMTWDGTGWTASSPPNAGHFTNALWAVACPTTTTCQALGYHMRDRHPATVAVGGS